MMGFLKYSVAAAIAGIVALSVAPPAGAAQSLKLGVCYDLSKAYTFATPQVSQAAKDLVALTNLKGGIGGAPIEVIVQDHGNEPQRGIECYEKLKREGVFIFDTLSTPVSIAMLPRVMQDKNILIQALVGRGDAVDGGVFGWVFPLGPTYWGQVANNVAYLKQVHAGNLRGVKIGFVYLDYPFGQEPIPILQTLAKVEGFELKLYPVPLPGKDQTSVWTQVRRDQPDHIISWLLAGAHVVASKEMKRNGIPMDKYISVNWLNEVDIANIGAEAAKGLKRGTNVAGGQDIPVIQEIIAELYKKGKGSGPEKNLKDVYYNTGLAMYSMVLEGARQAAKLHGTPISSATMREGLQNIASYDAGGLMAPVTVTSSDHGGGGKTRIEMWDGEKWIPQTEWIAAYTDIIWEVVRKSSSNYHN